MAPALEGKVVLASPKRTLMDPAQHVIFDRGTIQATRSTNRIDQVVSDYGEGQAFGCLSVAQMGSIKVEAAR